MPPTTDLPDPDPWDAGWFREALELITGNQPDTVGPARRLISTSQVDDRSVRVPKAVLQQDELWLDGVRQTPLTGLTTEHLCMLADWFRSVEVDWVGHALMAVVADLLVGRLTLTEAQDQIALLQRLQPGWMDRTPLMTRINFILAERARSTS